MHLHGGNPRHVAVARQSEMRVDARDGKILSRRS